jgi:anti-sigma B factor antagonist
MREADRLTIEWHGEVTAANAGYIRDATWLLLSEHGDLRRVLDLRDVRFIDSTGLGLLVSMRKHASDRNVPLDIINVQPQVENVIRISKLRDFLLGDGRRSTPVRETGAGTPVTQPCA